MSDCVVIVSGGLDSVTLLHYLVKSLQRQPAVITFAYGQKHIQEIECARYQTRLLGISEHTECDLSPMRDLFRTSALVASDIAVPSLDQVRGDPQPLTYVPNRNMIFLSLAAAFAESHHAADVFYGAQKADLYGYWDTTPDFLERINAVLSLNRATPIRVNAPFVEWSKAEIVRTGLDLSVDYSQTWSCYQGSTLACGICATCAERLAAFAQIGMTDPLPYESKTLNEDTALYD